MTTQLMLQTPR